jgi:hypothetical protein
MKKILIISQLIIFTGIILMSFWGCNKEDKNTPPVAGFTIMPGSGTLETIFSFNATGSSDREDLAAGIQVRWDWETDGLFDTDFSANKILDHQFTQLGTFQVTLEVKDSKDLGNSVTKTLVVEGMIPSVTTDTVINISINSATSGGYVTADHGTAVTSRGICWSTSPGPTVADSHTTDGTGTGLFVSQLTELTKNTTYYLRAYAINDIGPAYGNEVHFTTLNLWVCGEPFTISHIAGNVAPITKTVTYGTVTDIPGEPALCWITSNLGSDHQATSVDDASEASAGWYWQFNRMQGYKHDGTTRTPGTSWIYPIVDNNNWQSTNDPCALELGNGWRIPTQSEWVNVDEDGGWTNWNGPWNSALKLHASGDLYYTNGSLVERGTSGYYWSDLPGGEGACTWTLTLNNSACYNACDNNSFGFTLRCIK